ncbi:MAG: hypothetical protein K5886_09035, partial [Lachnospiraceae bacterium]|nr:hypothetical protein [Lachnospiraceae bacterium]
MERIRSNETLSEFLTGVGVWGAVVLIVSMIVSKRRLYAAAGLLVGLILAVFYIINLYSSIDASLDFDEKDAVVLARKKYLFRYLVICAGYVALALSGIGSL